MLRIRHRVSEELSSVETSLISILNMVNGIWFQKNLVVWKPALPTPRRINPDLFQKNLVVWKQGWDDIKYEVHPISWSTLTFGMKPRIAKFLYMLYGK